MGHAMSSIYHISKSTAPVFVIHGDSDPVVPLFQSESFGKIAKANGVPFELVVKVGAKHGWKNKVEDEPQFVAWFDKYLKP